MYLFILSLFYVYTSGLTIRARNEKSKTVFNCVRSTKRGHGCRFESHSSYRFYGVLEIWRRSAGQSYFKLTRRIFVSTSFTRFYYYYIYYIRV